jgi:trehalose 6-phosphate synthase/phosphatase
MPLSLRFVVPLALALAAIAYAVVPLVDRFTFQWFVRDLDTRGALISKTAQEPLAELVADYEPREKVLRYFERIIQDQRIYALGYCDRAGRLAYATSAFPEGIRCSTSEAQDEKNWVIELADGPLHVSANRIATADGEGFGELIIVHDMSALQRRSADTKKYVLWLFAAHSNNRCLRPQKL